MQVDLGDRKSGKNGVLGGILDTEEMIDALKKVVGTIDTSPCGNSPTFDAIASQIRQTSDILVDGTQDPERECGGISLGLGFETRATSEGAAVEPVPESDPCPDL